MNGIININKKKGLTSFDVVREIRKITKIKKVGHTGTLDPMAEGVLPICIGKATKFAEVIMSKQKIYKAEMKLGQVTDTYDGEGEVIEEHCVKSLNEKVVLSVVKSFIGTYSQFPPKYSALKVNGKRLYEYARAGEEVVIKPREVNIIEIYDIKIDLPYVSFSVHCSKGTYIRSLCYDIGRKLNNGAYMTALTRVKSGFFDIEDSYELEELNSENIDEKLISVERIFCELPEIKCNDKFTNLISNGVVINDRSFLNNIDKGIQYRVFTSNDVFLGLGEYTDRGFKIIKRYN